MISIHDGENMTDKQLLQAVALDRIVYPQSYWLNDETALGYLHACPAVYTYAADAGNLIGYINMSCIDEGSYHTLRGGRQNDLFITAANLRVPSEGKKNYLYFSSVAVVPAYRGRGIARKLFSRFGDKLALLRSRGIYFADVLADAISEHGEKLCLSLGMKYEKISESGGKLFRYPMDRGEPNAALDFLIKNMRGKE